MTDETFAVTDDTTPLAGIYVRLEDDAPYWARQLNENILHVYNKQIAAESLVSKIHGIVEELKPTVMEVVAGLQSNPMLKMFLGGKK